MKSLDVATMTTLHQVFFGFVLMFLIALFINRIGGKLRSILSSRFGEFYDYLVLPGCMCHELGRAIGCLITGTGFGSFEIFNLKTDDSERIPVAVSANSRIAFLRRFMILTGPLWFGALVVCGISVLTAGIGFLPSYSASFAAGGIGIVEYVSALVVESVKMVASLFFVWHWTSPFCLVVFYLLFCVGSQIRISPKSMLLIWQSVLCVFLILFILNLIPGVREGIAWMGEKAMPAVFVLHTTLLFVALINSIFYVVARMIFGKGKRHSGRGRQYQPESTSGRTEVRYDMTAFARTSVMLVLVSACGGWVGVDLKPLSQRRSQLAVGDSGTYYQLSDDERKELVWMAKAAKSAYSDGEKPLGYRSFTREEWNRCAVNCPELRYVEDGSFTVGSGLRGRLMVNMLNEGRVVLSLCGVDDLDMTKGVSLLDVIRSKDVGACVDHYFGDALTQQYDQALRLLQGVLAGKPRSHLWIVGHSLGGSLATFLALEIPESRTYVKCATFNGYGYSPNMQVSDQKLKWAKIRLRNVYSDGDPVYNWKLSEFAKGVPAFSLIDSLPAPRHFGTSYSVVGKGDAADQHELGGLLQLMIKHRTGWQGL